jgi:hypothetical protein
MAEIEWAGQSWLEPKLCQVTLVQIKYKTEKWKHLKTPRHGLKLIKSKRIYTKFKWLYFNHTMMIRSVKGLCSVLIFPVFMFCYTGNLEDWKWNIIVTISFHISSCSFNINLSNFMYLLTLIPRSVNLWYLALWTWTSRFLIIHT